MHRIFFPAVLLSVVFGAGATAQGPQWEVSGRVVRADMRAPIAGAKVFYQGQSDVRDRNGRVANPPSLQGEATTGPDGDYKITGLPAGGYRIRATAPGFLAAAIIGGPEPVRPQCCEPKTHRNDLRLQPDTIHLSTMNTEAFRKVHPQGLLPFNMIAGSAFSPNGELLAMALTAGMVPRQTQEMWLYRLATGQLKLLEYPPVGSFYASGLLWQGDQLYMRAALVSPREQPKQAFATASFDAETVKVLPTLPPALQAAYARLEKEADSNSRCRVWGESSCKIKPEPHCGQGMVLAVEDKSTRKQRIVTMGSDGYFSIHRTPLSFIYPALYRHPAGNTA